MYVEQVDMSKIDKVVESMDSLAQRRRAQGGSIYYDLIADAFRRVRGAKDEGKFLVGHTVFVPTEILFAMDIVPLYLEGMSEIMARIHGMEDAFGVAKAHGFASEICSAHRLVDAMTICGWMPRPDAYIWSNQVCDLTAKTGDYLSRINQRPGFYLDRPYHPNEQGVTYFIRELQEMVRFLEEFSGKKLDWNRLRQAMVYSKQAADLFSEICEMRKQVPSPMPNQYMIEMILGQLLASGSPDLVSFYEHVRDDVRKRADAGKGVVEQENYRLLTFFFYPAYLWKLLNAMQAEYGAVIVAEPHLSPWADGKIDPDEPLESLTRKAFALLDTGPLVPFVDKVMHEAREYKADGAIYWAHIGCRQTCATIRIIKDKLMEELGIPTLVVDCDLADPTYASGDSMKEKLDEFFELLEERK